MTTKNKRTKPVLTAWRLVGLGPTPDVALSPNMATEFAPRYPAAGSPSPDFAATVTVDGASGDALLERRGGFDAATMTAGGEVVTDVAHLSPGEEVCIDGQTWVYLKPMQIFFRTGSSREGRRAALAEAMRQLPSESPLLRCAEMPSMSPQVAEASLTGERPSLAASKTAIKSAPNFAPKAALKAATWGGAGLVAALVVAGMLRQKGDAVVPAEAVRVVSSAAPVTAPANVTPAPAAAAPVAPSPAAGPETLAAAQQTGSGGQQQPASVAEHQPVTAKDAAPVAARQVVPGTAQPGRQGAAAAPKAPSRGVDPQLAAQLRQKVAEYVLEARFDPEGARLKLEGLLAEIPAGSGMATEVKRQIQLLPH